MGERPVGRRPGDAEETKAQILLAARERFSAVGFERATIRSIAALAEVDPALVVHHFGNKQSLFGAAHELPFDPSELFVALRDLPGPQRGEALARTFLSVVMAPNSPSISLLRTAATNEAAATMLREFIMAVFLSHADWLAPGPTGPRRLALVGSHMVGIVFGRLILGVAPLVEATVDELVELVTPTIDQYLNGPNPNGTELPS